MHASTVVLWTVAVFYLFTVHGQPVKTSQGGLVGGVQCRRAEIPANRPQGSNRLSSDNWDPLYRLSVSKDGQQDYTVSVQAGNSLLPFSDAFISAETNGSCGVGEFRFDDQDFHHVVQPPALGCPLLLITNRKSVMQRLPPLRWKPPLCGCVHFRANVIEASTVYYAEHAHKAEGALATTVCSPLAGHAQQQMTMEERTELLCQVTGRHSGLSVIQRPSFLHNHRLEPRYMDTRKIDLALSTRHHDISECCAKTGQDSRQACLTNVRRRRVDGVCEDGVPDIPFTVLRASFMRQREEACCWRLAEARYTCYSEGAELKAGRRSADFSLDETDPLNDLADFEEELLSLEREVGTTFIARARLTTTTPFLPSPTTTTTPTTTPPTPTTTTPTTTTTTTTTAPSPQLSRRHPPLPSHQQFPPSSASSSGQRGPMEHWTPPEWEGVEEAPSPVSREIGEQGGRSIDKTFAALQRRMWKLSVKARCCQAGMGVAQAAYGDFNAVWTQCQHSATKHLASRPLLHGHKICASQFQRCCMETVIRLPPEVVTMAPDTASSREWDRDRHLVHTLYLPPHARPRPDMTSQQKQALLSSSKGGRKTSAERRRGLLKPKAPKPTLSAFRSLFVDEPEIDEEPQNKRPKSRRRPSSRERGGRSRARLAGLDEDLSSLRRQRRLRKLNSRERKKLGSRRSSRERMERLRASSRRYFDPEEDPAFQKPRRKLSNGGRSKEHRNGQLRREHPPSAPAAQVEEGVIPQENQAQETTPERIIQHQPPSDPSRSSDDRRKDTPDAEQTAPERREQGRQIEAAQLKHLFAKIAEDVDEDDDEASLGEDVDNGSEETPDSLGLDIAVIEDDEDEDFDDYESDENEDLVDDPDVDGDNDENVGKPDPQKQGLKPEDSDDVAIEQSDEERQSQSKQMSNEEEPAVERREPEVSPPKSESSNPLPVPGPRESQEMRRRSRLLRLRSKGGLSEEDGHSGGRSSRRRRKHHHGRKRMRNLRHHKRRMRSRFDLGEALEED